MKKEEEFIEPVLVKAGDGRLRIGPFGQVSPFDCRVLAEDNYQLLKKGYDDRKNLFDMVVILQKRLELLIDKTPSGKHRNKLTEDNISALILIDQLT